MKILLVGGMGNAATLIQALMRADDHEITHCADATHAVAELLEKKFDWAIMDGRARREGERDIARVIRAMGPHAHGGPAISVCTESCHAANPPGQTSCGVEWTRDGILQLHCGLHSLLRNAAKSCGTEELDCVGDILFEYHAPCSKGRGRT